MLFPTGEGRLLPLCRSSMERLQGLDLSMELSTLFSRLSKSNLQGNGNSKAGLGGRVFPPAAGFGGITASQDKAKRDQSKGKALQAHQIQVIPQHREGPFPPKQFQGSVSPTGGIMMGKESCGAGGTRRSPGKQDELHTGKEIPQQVHSGWEKPSKTMEFNHSQPCQGHQWPLSPSATCSGL